MTSVNVDDGHDLDNGLVAIDLTVVGNADIECFVPKWSAWSDDADISIRVSDWDGRTVRVGDRRGGSRLLVTVTFEEASHDVSDPEVTDIEDAAL